MWTLAKQAKLQSFHKKPSYILLYIVVCKICSVCCISSRYNFIAKSYPMLDVLLMILSPPKGFPFREAMWPRHAQVSYRVQSIMATFSSSKDYAKYISMCHRLAKV
jgi:hypothetical protein